MPVDENIDIWNFGCQIYELLTATQLFATAEIGDDSDEETDDDKMREFDAVLGAFPIDR